MTREEIIQSAKTDGGMFAVIPSVVMRDETLSMSARLLYGIITWKCNGNACCWHSNRVLGEEMGLSPKRVSALLSTLESQGHIETEIIKDEETGQILKRNIYPIVKSGRCLKSASPNGNTSPRKQGYPIPEYEDTPPRKCGDPILKNEEEKYKEEIQKENTYPHFSNAMTYVSEIHAILSVLCVADDERAATMTVIAALEDHGYICQNEVPVPRRSEDATYSGRIGIVATKAGMTFALEVDRKSVREKSLYKLRAYPCDARIIVLRGGGMKAIPDGIDDVIPLRLQDIENYFHTFWDAYPKKQDKRRAFDVFKRLNVTAELLNKMLTALEAQKRSDSWQKDSGRYIPHATTWLNGARWEDEIESSKSVGTHPISTPKKGWGWD